MVMEEELYKSALESKQKYQREELTDFDEFMDEIEKGYLEG